MKTTLDCIPCFIRQALDTARMVMTDQSDHERIVRDVLHWAVGIDLDQSPPRMAQRIHRHLRQLTGNQDPYRAAKDYQNRMALTLLPNMRAKMADSPDSLLTAVRLAIAGNIIDMGVHSKLTAAQLQASIQQALSDELVGYSEFLRRVMDNARRILYLTDNAGEIVFDRLLIEVLGPERVTVAVRGAPVINDATSVDAHAVKLDEIVAVTDNGSDAPGTLLDDCSAGFKRQFTASDLILAKGQGNFETLSDVRAPVVFLFQAKCPVIASHARVPQGSHVLKWFYPETFNRVNGSGL